MTLESLIQRDGGTCVWCGAQPWVDDLSADHLLPRARSGRGLPENLALACRRCNRRRSATSVAAYVRTMRAEGLTPRLDLITVALERLSSSQSRPHAAYARRQLRLLERL
jgi:5-methylcytosine-specific restriction endonuclease McrA